MDPLQILLVEHSPEDVDHARQVVANARIATDLHVVDDGEAALSFLRRESEFADRPRPDLVLLALNLPRKDGREVLAELRGDPDLHTIPVVVLTVSTAERDIVRSYELSADMYVSKPIDPEEFVTVLRSLENVSRRLG